jgi:predicted nucleic acid-binding protein
MYILDTNVISEMRKLRPHGALLQWYRAQKLDDLFLSSITLYELQRGSELTRRQDRSKAAEIEQWITTLSTTFDVLPLDGAAAQLTAKFMARHSSDMLADAMIAALAFTYDLTVATRNVRDFEGFPVAIINPFAV